MPASVFQRLRNLARERAEDVNALLVQYAVERLLYRVSRSSRSERYVLKGAMLFRVWTGALHRPTLDLDLLGYGDAEPQQVAADFAAILRETDDPNDGLVFDHASVTATEIREAQEYPGVRVRIPATLGSARAVVQVDVGFGDAITPEARHSTFPTLLGHDPPEIRAYPQETAVAEKLQAICALGLPNSRMKDYYDLVLMSQWFEFDGATLARAIRSTFERRATALPDSLPIGLSDEFAASRERQSQWRAFLTRTRLTDAPQQLGEVVRRVRAFLEPPLNAASTATPLIGRWQPARGWTG